MTIVVGIMHSHSFAQHLTLESLGFLWICFGSKTRYVHGQTLNNIGIACRTLLGIVLKPLLESGRWRDLHALSTSREADQLASQLSLMMHDGSSTLDHAGLGAVHAGAEAGADSGTHAVIRPDIEPGIG